MPSGSRSILRWFAPLLALLVGIQTVLPLLHVASEHLHPAPAAVDHRTACVADAGAVADADHADADGCAVCHFLAAVAPHLQPGPPAAPVALPAVLVVRRLAFSPVRARAPPDIVWSSPRGPPTA